MFAFFTTFIATAESLCYSAYVIGAMVNPAEFDLNENSLENLTPAVVKGAFSSAYRRDGDKFVSAFKALIKTCDVPYKVPNQLSHHGSPPQHVAVGSGAGPVSTQTTWGRLAMKSTLTAELRKELAGDVAAVVAELLAFVQKYMAVP